MDIKGLEERFGTPISELDKPALQKQIELYWNEANKHPPRSPEYYLAMLRLSEANAALALADGRDHTAGLHLKEATHYEAIVNAQRSDQ